MSKIWLITGAGRGLGRSILEAALAAGNKVVATARDPERLADLRERYGDRLLNPALDVTNPAHAHRAVMVAEAAYGGLDVLVNTAGYAHPTPLAQAGDEGLAARSETNFLGTVNLIRAALPVMRNQRAGHIINISSLGGRVATPGFTAALARDVGPFGIKVTALQPDAPDEIAWLVVELSGRQESPRRLMLGGGAFQAFRQPETGRRSTAAEWAASARRPVSPAPNSQLC
ncbi:SDR family NAD(P)-dependent oxidoreductase [Labrys sp. KB_33_2]|uniref:SDR family NAD(P)-dependent oxidoreductase n=1 Tax=unclassified Labrys (in: a-proteobacteria) TaxID=2688601 RepID=UPI003EC04290